MQSPHRHTANMKSNRLLKRRGRSSKYKRYVC